MDPSPRSNHAACPFSHRDFLARKRLRCWIAQGCDAAQRFRPPISLQDDAARRGRSMSISAFPLPSDPYHLFRLLKDIRAGR